MDEVLDVMDIVLDLGLESVVTWVLRLVGLLALFGGLGLWLLTDMGLLFVPAWLMALEVLLLVVPSILFAVLEVA